MAVQLKGQSTWAAKAQEQRNAEIANLYEVWKLRPDDEIRFPKVAGSSTKLVGKPLAVAADGSITCSVKGKVRAVLPERIEVKMRGPRGGVKWERLVPDDGKATT